MAIRLEVRTEEHKWVETPEGFHSTDNSQAAIRIRSQPAGSRLLQGRTFHVAGFRGGLRTGLMMTFEKSVSRGECVRRANRVTTN
jgi:hypothetical protein